MEYSGIEAEEEIYCISFSLRVEGLIESKIMQIFTDPVVNDIASAMLSDEATVVTRETPTPQPTAPVAAPKPEPGCIKARGGQQTGISNIGLQRSERWG